MYKTNFKEHNNNNFVFYLFVFYENYPKRYYLVVMVSKEMDYYENKDFLIKTNKQTNNSSGNVVL